MKKPSGTRVNIMIMGIVIVVLALGLAAILGYGKARKQMEQMQQAQQEQEAKEAQITPTQTVTPEPTDDPTDPAVQKKNLITEIKKAVEHNDVKIMTADLRYTSQKPVFLLCQADCKDVPADSTESFHNPHDHWFSDTATVLSSSQNTHPSSPESGKYWIPS